MESILFSTPILMVICLGAALLHVIEFLLGGKLWMSALNVLLHVCAILAFLFLRATLADVLILLMFSVAVCLFLRLIRRNNK